MKMILYAIALLAIVAGGVAIARDGGREGAGDVRNVDMLSGATGTPVAARAVAYHGTTSGWYAEPVSEGDYPGVVMIHEWWGLNDHIRSMAEELAREGYRVLAVDLYDGRVAVTSSEARALSSAVSADKAGALANMRDAAGFLREEGADRIASLGWCFGGARSLELSLSEEDLDATVIYYGQLVTDREALREADEPILGIFGEADASIPTSTVELFDRTLDEIGAENEIYVYPGVGHAFANPSGMNYAPEPTRDAWQKTLSFLEASLKR